MPHGMANAILLPYVEEFNLEARPEKTKKLAEVFGISTQNLSAGEIKTAVIDYLKNLSAKVGIPKGLREMGVKEEDFGKLADQALRDVCTGGNPRPVTKEDIIAIYKHAMQ